VYAPPEDDFELLAIYDANGYIAGMHSVVPKDVTANDLYYPFSSFPWYRAMRVLNKEVYLTTAYFVDVKVICEGRTAEQFADQGLLLLLIMVGWVTRFSVLALLHTWGPIMCGHNIVAWRVISKQILLRP
jgi:hypothetical protein